MAKKIKAENLSKEILNYLQNAVEDINTDVTQITNTLIKEAKKELVEKSPKSGVARGTKYYKGWTIKNANLTFGKNFRFSKMIWNKTNYQLTHLLEFGHRTRNGTGYVEAQPHIRKIEDKYREKFIETLEKNIRRN